jgi:glycosyltransferase involved in cell wall biosynthesis
MKKVSVVIPCFNCEKLLLSTLESVQNQSYPNIEIIVVDDGSSDSTLEIANQFSGRDIKVIPQLNRGACAARNLGLSISTGEYIMFLDADDIISKNKIKEQVAVIEKEGSSTLPFCGWGRFYKSIDDFAIERQPVNKNYRKPINYLIDCWNGRGMWQTSIFLMHRELIEKAGRWNEEILINQDGEFFARVILQAEKLIFTEGLVYYRSGNRGSISGSKVSYVKASSLLKSYQLYQNHLNPEDSTNVVKEALGANFISFFYRFYDQYPDLAEDAYKNFLRLEVRVTNGGKGFNLLRPLFGVKGALKFKSLLKKK